MFFYFYDTFVNSKKHEGVLSQVENRLIELGINGRIEKFSVLKNMEEMIKDGIKNEAHTVVAVGDDSTFIKVMRVVSKHKDIVLGFIPVGQNTKLAHLLGIENALEGCDVLSKRLTKRFDLGQVREHCWLTSLEMPEAGQIKLKCDNKYTVTTTNPQTDLSICNLGRIWQQDDQLYNIEDGKLNVVVTTDDQASLKIFGNKAGDKEGVFPVKKIEITSQDKADVIVDHDIKLKTPLEVTIKPKAIKIIVGKDRKVN